MTEENQYKPCPYCKEEIRADAIKCRHCQSMLEEAPESPLEALRGKGSLSAYPRANLGKRFVAFVVDSLIATLGVFFILVFLIFSGIGGMFFLRGFSHTSYHYHSIPGLAELGIFLAFILVILLIVGWSLVYTLLKDGLGNGQSLGKRLVGLMVIKLENGEPCTFGVSALRNLTLLAQNLVPYVGFLIEPVVTLAHEKGYRLGDMLANTQVIEVEQYQLYNNRKR